MPRLRALFAILLAVTWCSAAWHVDLEAAGLMLEHQHHGHADAGDADRHAPAAGHEDHERVMVRDVVKDGQFRLGPTGVLWFVLVGIFLACAINLGRRSGEREPVPIGGRTAQPQQRVWQFVQRCAPISTAPPALG
ncbi:MAG: hypothetical protein ACREH8_23725 [Opitutaceae bacterium]